eukprot:5631546-Prymnesium_polylepis.1
MSITAVGADTVGGSPKSTAESWCVVRDSEILDGVHASSAVSDEQWRSIVDAGGSIYEIDTEAEAREALTLLDEEASFVDATPADDDAAQAPGAAPACAPAAA